jgi:5'-3' exonuclease
MRPIEAKLTDEEKGRNKHGPHLLFQYTPDTQGTFTSILFPDIVNHHAKLVQTFSVNPLYWFNSYDIHFHIFNIFG